MSIPLVYIAGPYTAPDAWSIELNVRRAEEAAYEVARLGAMPVCPHTNLRWMAADLAEFLYPATLELMRRCDAVLFLPGWTRSKGAKGEWNEAESKEIPQFYSLESIGSWIVARRGGL